jgi:hypothetical protein
MESTPLWLVLLTVVVGPAVTASLVTFLGQRRLQEEKTDLDTRSGKVLADYKSRLDKRLAEHKDALDRASAQQLTDYKSTLDQGLAEHRHALRFSHQRPRCIDVSTSAAAATTLIRQGQRVTRCRARQRPSSAWARSVGARSAVSSRL